MSDPERAVASRPPRRRWRYLGGLAVIAALLAVGVGFARAPFERAVHRRIEQGLARWIDGRASIEEVQLQLLRLELRFRGARLSGGVDGARADVEIDGGVVRLAWRGLLGLRAGRVQLGALGLQRPRIRIDRPFLDRWSGGRAGDRAVDWSVDHLRIAQGILQYADSTMPLEIVADDVGVNADWNRYRRALSGRVVAAVQIMQPPLARPLPLRFSSAFRLAARRLELSDLTAESEGLELERGEGSLIFEGGLPLSLRAWVTADAARVASWIGESPHEVRGDLKGELFVERRDGPLLVTGRLQGGGVVLGPLNATSLETGVAYLDHRLLLDGLRLEALGGRLEGDFALSLGAEARFTTELQGVGLDVAQLLELVGLQLPVASRGRLSIEVGGDPTHPASWSATGKLSSDAASGIGPGRVPCAVRASFELERGRVRVAGAQVDLPHAAVGLDLALDVSRAPLRGEVAVRVDTDDLLAAEPSARRLLEALGLRLSQLAEHRLQATGRGRIHVRLAETVRTEVQASLERGSLNDEPFERAEIAFDADATAIELRQLSVEGQDWSLEASGAFAASPFSIDTLQLKGQKLPVRSLARLIGVGPEMDGRLTTEVGLQRGDSGLDGNGTATLHGLEVLGEQLDTAELTFEVRQDLLRLRTVHGRGPALEFSGHGTVVLDTLEADGELVSSRIDLARLQVMQAGGVQASGDALLHGPVRWKSGRLLAELALAGPDWELAGVDAGEVRGRVSIDEDGVDFKAESGQEHGITVEGRIRWAEGLPLTGVAHLANTTVEPPVTGSRDAWARVTGEVLVEGPLSEPSRLIARGSLRSADLHLGTRRLGVERPIDFRLADGLLNVGPARFEGPQSYLDFAAQYRFGAREIEASLAGVLDAGVAAALFPNLRASGPLQVRLEAQGPVASPDVRGRLEVSGANLRILGFPEAISDVRLAIALEGKRAVLHSARARVGGGELQATGEMRLEGATPDSYILRLELANVRLSYPKGFRGVYEGQLELAGDRRSSTASGRLDLIRGLYDRDFELVELLGYGGRQYDPQTGWDLPVDVFLDLNVAAEGNVWVRNERADLEARLDLHLGGAIDRPEVTGRIWVEEGGKVRFRDVEYRVQSGSLDLLELQRINPYVDLRAETSVREYQVFLHVEGTLDKLEYELTSEPALSPQDILALLTTGETLENLNTAGVGSRGLFARDAVTNYFASTLTQPFERQLKRLLGFDRVRIDPLLVQGQADPTTRLTLGKQVGDSVFITYSTDLGSTTEEQLYEVEWQATRRFKLAAERNRQGGIGGDIRYAKRFWLRGRPDTGAARGRVQSAQPARKRPADDTRPRIGVIDIRGAEESELAELRQSLPFGVGDPFSRSSMLEGAQHLRRYYVRRSRIEAEVDALAEDQDDGRVRVSYEVHPGPKVLSTVEGMGRRHTRKMGRRLESAWLEPVFLEERYEAATRWLFDYLHTQGFYTADVAVHSEQDGPLKRVRFVVDPGEVVKVERVVLEGVDQLSESDIRRQMLTRGGGLFARKPLIPEVLEEDIGAVRALYRDNGFLQVKIEEPQIRLSSAADLAEVLLRIEEGPRFRFGRIEVPEGLPVDEAQVLRWAGVTSGSVFSPARLLQVESGVRTGFDRQGYPDTRVSAQLEQREMEVDVRLLIETGPLKRIGEIAIRGNRRIRQRAIERELQMTLGDPVSRDGLLQAQHRLYKTRIFRSVRMSVEPLGKQDPSLHRVVVEVTEAPPLGVVLGGGYDTETGARATFSVTHGSARGQNRQVALQGRLSGVEQRLQWIVQDQRVLGSRDWRALFNVFWEEREQTAFTAERRSAALRAEKELGDRERWRQYFRYNFQEVDLSNVQDPDAATEQKLDDLRLADLAYALIHDTRDDPFAPTHGTYASAGLRLFEPVLGSEQRFLKFFLQGSGVRTFRNGTAFASGVRLGIGWPLDDATRDDGIPISERFFAGGDSTLRGFERDGLGPRSEATQERPFGVPVGGEALFLINEEFRYPIWKALRGTVFYDAGNVYPEAGDLDLSDLRHVLGVGLRLETPLGPLRLEYGRKLDRNEGESRGQLFLAIGTAF